MAYAIITTHVQDAVDTLTSAFKERPKATGLVAAMAQQVQELEDAIAKVNQARLLFGGGAVGAQLDVLGRLVGFDREGLDDSNYLALIFGAIAKNSSDATTESILTVLALIWQSDAIYIYDPNSPNHSRRQHPATVQLAIGSPKTPSTINPTLVNIVQETLGAAVDVAHVSVFDTAGVFACAGPQAWVRGCSDLQGNGGAPCADLIFSAPQV